MLKIKFWQSLRFKLIASTLAVEVIMLSVLMWNNLRLSEEALVDQNISEITTVLPLLNASFSGLILQEDIATLNEIIAQIITDNGLRYIKITNTSSEIFVQYGKPKHHKVHHGFDLDEFRQHLLVSGKPYLFSTEIKLDNSVVGYMELEFDISDMIVALSETKREGLVIASIEIILSAIILLLIGITLTRRLGRLSRAVSEMASGNHAVRIKAEGHGEVAQTAEAFNTMAETVQNEQAQLKKSESDLALTLDSIGDGVIVTDIDGNVTRINLVAEKLTGWTIEQAYGKPLTKVFDIIHASTRMVLNSPVEKALKTGKAVDLSNHALLIAKQGQEYHIADSASPIINDEGETLGVILVFRDISNEYMLREDRDKSRQRLQAILDNTPSIIYLKDLDGRFILINKRFETLFDISNEEIQGKTLFDVFPKNVAAEMHENDLDVLHSRVPLQSEEQAPQADGVHTYISTKFCLFNDNTEPYALCGVSTDITDQRNQEDLLKRTQKMDALGKLTGGIAHDYNNMLNVVLGYAELLNDELDKDSKLERYVKEISIAAQRGAALTRKLLAFSSHQSSTAGVIDINALLKEDENMLAKTLTARIELRMQLTKDIWPVFLDSSDLEDAILNMCINSMHAMPNGGKITITTNNETFTTIEANVIGLDSKGDYVHISISDNGSGMDSSVQARIFDPFFSTKGQMGTGLGLSQVYGFTQRSQGNVKVHSEPGQGTRLSMYFPRYADVVDEVEPLVLRSAGNTRGNEVILVVDDEPALRYLARDILDSYGYQILLAADANEALSILSKQPVDMLLSDVIMPGMDGYELASVVRCQYPKVIIQLASGYTADRQIKTGDKDLYEKLLHKPFSTELLLKRIRALFDEDVTMQ